MTRLGRILAAGLSAACLGISAPVATAAPAAQPNISTLITALSKSDSEIAALELKMGGLREAVNKALVDFHTAQADAKKAREDADKARSALSDTQEKITQAQKLLDDISNAIYRGSSAASLSSVAGKQNAEDALTRQTMLRTNAEKQRSVVEELDKLRTQQANEESTLRAARDDAEKREKETEKAQQDAQKAIETNTAALKTQQEEHAKLVSSRDAAQKQIDAARGTAKPQEAATTTQAAAAAPNIADSIAKLVGSSQPDHASLNLAADNPQTEPNVVFTEDEQDLEEEETEEGPTQETNKDKDGDLTLDLNALSSNGPGSLTKLLQKLSESGDGSAEQANINLNGDRESKIETVIARAESQLGVTYAWGGGDANGPTLGIHDGGVADSFGDYNKVGFDCSGLTLYAFAGVGIALPHYTGYQYQHGTKVSPQDMQRGDLIFYGPNAEEHVAIYLGDDQMIEAPQSGSEVMISPVRWGGMSPSVVRLL
ncbi:MAG: NlpC/P60 family protein [Corynebacterium sp.]|nr:NlpC/P60 family protein [Corynebacterium sp.]